jgi:hypothetical protein
VDEKPIGVIEAEFRKRGAFVLVDVKTRKLWFYHHSKDMSGIRNMMDSLKGRQDEMVNFLIACIRGETK